MLLEFWLALTITDFEGATLRFNSISNAVSDPMFFECSSYVVMRQSSMSNYLGYYSFMTILGSTSDILLDL